jgi:HK97 family phage prohead protease
MGRMKNKRELRYLNFELREDEDSKLIGYASLFNIEAVIWGIWREQIALGAYTETIIEDDIRALWNHDTGIVLGRNKAGTLHLSEDAKGLKVEIEPPDTQWGRDAVTSIKRGDVSQMSIAFCVKEDSCSYPADSRELPLRTNQKSCLFEVSPVTFPAFIQTSISARSQALEILTAAMPTKSLYFRRLRLALMRRR